MFNQTTINFRHKYASPWTVILMCLFLGGAVAGCDQKQDAKTGAAGKEDRPNILLIVADDMGYSDIGSFGGEIETPNLDALAASGMQLTNYYVHSTCSPTRAMLLAGVDSHVAGLGTMRGLVSPEQEGKPGYETHLNLNVVTIASLLQDAGYHTYMAGKWHMGEAPELLPHNRGFEESYALVPGTATHFSQRGSLRDRPIADYRHNGKSVTLPEKFYSTEFYTDRIIENIDKNHEDGKPFFAYTSYTAPHWPLQAPDEYIAKYEGVYDVGYDEIRKKRLEKMRSLGIISDDLKPATQTDVWPSWESLTKHQKKVEAKRMQIYAAMISALDHHIGRLISHLEEIGELDNTLIIFMSDNGPDGTSPMDLLGNDEWVPATFDQSYENMGQKNSYVWYGPGWGHVSATPFKLFKTFVSEGGLRVPALFSMPEKIKAGGKSDAFTTVLDIYPTILEQAGIPYPKDSYKDRTIHPLKGKSLNGLLSGNDAIVHDKDDFMGWELFNRRAIRQGDWKVTWINKPWGKGDGLWALYNLKNDPTEQHDLADENPEKLAHMITLWDQYVEENGVLPLDKLEMRWTNTTDHYQWDHPENK